jgi:glycosyltransferase involved in cell wall biosynthesis
MSSFIYKSSVGCLKFPYYFRFWRDHIFSLLGKNNYDAIHIHDLPLLKIGAEAKKKYGIRLIIDLHENYPALLKDSVHTTTLAGRILSSNKQWTAYEKRYLPDADLVITVVEEAAARIEKLGIDKSNICIVSNTFDIGNDRIETFPGSGNDFTLFYGGAINRHRGLQVVLQAIKLLDERKVNIKLMIAGSGSYMNRLRKMISDLGIESNVAFYGFLPFNEMLNLLGKADAGIIPHLRTDNNNASSPNKLYQYMYLKKPVISSDCDSLKRIITSANSGLIYKNDSPSELSSLLEKVKGNKQLLAEMGENGRKAVILKYNWNSDKTRLTDAYSGLKPV